MQITESKQTSRQYLNSIRLPVNTDLEAADNLIVEELESDIPLIREITQYIIKSGGKRLRPLLVILSAKACGYKNGIEHLELATIIEFVHTATLLHDDVVDNSKLRRGKVTANAIWGNQASVLVGDFLYSRAFQILARRSNIPIMKVLANTTNAIAEGEVLQLMNQHNPQLGEADYIRVITRKTAKLFESSAEIGALVANSNNHVAMATYGLNIGLAFQIIDDVLDYLAESENTGKNIGEDLAEGKMTLPLIYTLNNCNKNQAKLINDAIQNGRLENLNEILLWMQENNAKEYCLTKAKQLLYNAEKAISLLADSPYRRSLVDLLSFVIERNY